MTGIKIPVGAQFDQSSVESELRAFVQKINTIGASIGHANKVQFNPIAKGTLDEVSRVTQAYERLLKVSSGLSGRVKATGQSGRGFGDLDWSSLYVDAKTRNRQMQKAYEYVVGGAFHAPAAAPGGGGSGGGGGGGGNGRPPPRHPAPAPAAPPPRGPTWGSTGAGVAQAGLAAAGPVGGVASGALGAGMSAGFGAGLMGLVGGLAALGIGKAVSAVMEKVGAAEREAIGYDVLKRQIGDVNVSFSLLRDTVRKSAADLNTTYDESQRLAGQFARAANIGPGGASGLGGEVTVAGGLARALGLDLGQGVGFSASMRQFGATEDETGSRRMALLVGETIARASGFAKAGEILQAIASFTEQQTRMGLNSANVSGYSGYLAAAAGSGIPGLDPAGAAGLLSRVNSSVISGGSDAGQNFYGYLGSSLGLDPLQMAVLREQGAFGTGRKAFGEGSVYSRFASANGLGTPGMGSSDQMTITSVIGQLRQQYGSNPMMMANAMQNLLGLNLTQSMAFSSLSPKELGGMESRLGRLGIKLGDVDTDGMSLLGQIESGNRPALAQVAQDLAGREGVRALSSAEQSKLQSAWDGGDDSELRDTLAVLVSKYGQAESDGEKIRNSIAGVDRTVQDYATKMLPIADAMRTGILYLAGGKDGKSSQQVLLEAESNDRKAGIAATFNAARSDIDRREESARMRSLGVPMEGERVQDVPIRQEAAFVELENLRKERAKLKEREVEQIKAESDRLIDALQKETLAAEARRKAYEDALVTPATSGFDGRTPAQRFPLGGTPANNSGGSGGGGATGMRAARAGAGAGIIGSHIAEALDAEGITDPTERRNVAMMLGGVSGVEGAGWNTVVGGSSFDDFSGHPGRVGLVTGDGPSTAAGAFQITGTTWRGAARQNGLSDFSPKSQARAAIALMRGRGALGLVRGGDFTGAAGRLGSEWQGLPTGNSPHQGRRSWGDFSGHLDASGAAWDAYTSGDGGAMPASGNTDGGGGRLGSGLYDPNPIGGTFTHTLELSNDAQRLFNPLPPVTSRFGPPQAVR